MRKQKLVSNNIYHVYNRGVEKREIFLDVRDYKRFMLNLAFFNNTKSVSNTGRKSEIMIKNDLQISVKNEGKPFIDILAFCLMPNHYHLLIRQKEENGISKFMNKVGVGYANYFNLKYHRVGPLFQGKFKSVLVKNESQLLYIPHYIHLNPVDFIRPNWRENGIKKVREVIDFLDSFRWSSYRDYTTGKSNFPFLNKNIVYEYFNGAENYAKDIKEFIGDAEFSAITELLID